MTTHSLPITASAAPFTGPGEDGGNFLTVTIGGRAYALGIEHVQAVVPTPALAVVSAKGGPFHQLVTFRDRPIPLLDLREKFNLPAPRTSETRAVILQTELTSGRTRRFGLVVDRVDGIARLASAELDALPGTGAASARDFLLGITRQDNRVRLIPELNLAVTAEVAEMMRGV